jgi:hypothetical protein
MTDNGPNAGVGSSFVRLCAPVLVAAASVGVYLEGLNGEFVYDDLKCVVENKDVTDTLDRDVLTRIVANDYWCVR